MQLISKEMKHNLEQSKLGQIMSKETNLAKNRKPLQKTHQFEKHKKKIK